MFEFDEKIAEQLTQITVDSAVQARCGTTNSFNVIASMLHPLLDTFHMGGVYICASRGAEAIIEALVSIGIDVSSLYFIDCVSSSRASGTETDNPNIFHVDSPVMLESILLRTMFIMRTIVTERNFIFIDSVNALAIYNEDRLLNEYLHTVINTFRAREVLSLIVNVPDQTPTSVLANLELYCTDTIDRAQVVIQ